MKENMKIEVNQLWLAAQKYFDLALNEKKRIPEKDINLTVFDLTDKKTTSKLQNYKNIVFFTSHISSCAIRLYSIDVNFAKDTESGTVVYNLLCKF